MQQIPPILNRTKVMQRLRNYMKEEFSEVRHTTLNPDGPGCVRIHLIPPKEDEGFVSPSVAVVNGTDVVPVNFFWAIMLCELIKQVNVYDGRELGGKERNEIVEKTADAVSELVRFGFIPLVGRKKIVADIETLYRTFTQIAYRQEVTEDVRPLSIGEYADRMKAPHRMDLMVSAMTRNGQWHCNQKCVHCYAAGQTLSDEEELSTEQWKAILDRCRAVGIPQITFTGGEPTMREDLPELAEHAKWFVTRINTNGIRLTKEYCGQLKAAEVDSIQITYYSSNPEIHNALVGAPQHENTTNGIKNALEAGLSLSINTPLCTLNRDYVKTLEFLHSLGIIYVTCSGLITTGNAVKEDSESLQLTSAELEEILRQAAEYCRENEMEIAFTSPGWIDSAVMDELGLPAPTCGACLSNMAITPGGNVVPCQSWLSEEPLGNMLEDSWEDIWNSERCAGCRNFSAEMSGRCPLRRYC